MTTLVEAKQIILDAFVLGWAAQTPVFITGEDHDDPPIDAPFVRITIRHFTRNQETLGGTGARKFEAAGSIVVQVFAPLDEGTTPADNLASNVQAILEAKTLTGAGTEVHTNSATITEIGETDDGYQINVSTSFYYQQIK